MNAQILRQFMRLLTVLRTDDYRDISGHRIAFGRCLGYASALFDAGLITMEQWFQLDNLTLNASRHSGEPLPDSRNAGPVMPASVALKRRFSPAEVVSNESEQVSAPAPRRELRLLCLLRPATGSYQPAATLRPMPPRVGPVGRWQVADDPALVLRETQARVPSAEVLARCERHRQSHAFRADPRAFRAEGVSHVR